MNKKISDLKNMRDIQCTKGNYDQGEYMRGLANGLEMALSIFEEREPIYFDANGKEDHSVSIKYDGFKYVEEG